MKRIYLFLLAALIGCELSIGVLLAPTLFHANDILGLNLLSRLQSGLLMSQVFVKFNYVLVFVAVFGMLLQSYEYFKHKGGFKKRFSKLMLGAIILVLSLLFVFYFSAYILEAARTSMEGVQMQEFDKIHKASEYCLKIIMLAQLILFFLSYDIAKKE